MTLFSGFNVMAVKLNKATNDDLWNIVSSFDSKKLKETKERIKQVLDNGADINMPYPYDSEYNLLRYAIIKKSISLFAILIKNNIDVNYQNKNGRVPLQWLTMTDIFSRNTWLNYLVKYGANIYVNDTLGESVLHTFVKSGDFKCVETLIANYVNPNTKRNDGFSPLDTVKKYISLYKDKNEKVEALTKIESLLTKNLDQFKLIYKIETDRDTNHSGYCYIDNEKHEILLNYAYDNGYGNISYSPFTDKTEERCVLIKITQNTFNQQQDYIENLWTTQLTGKIFFIELPKNKSTLYLDTHNMCCIQYDENNKNYSTHKFLVNNEEEETYHCLEEKVLEKSFKDLQDLYNQQQTYLDTCHQCYLKRYDKKDKIE